MADQADVAAAKAVPSGASPAAADDDASISPSEIWLERGLITLPVVAADAAMADRTSVFLEALTLTSNVRLSARTAGIGVSTVYGWRRSDQAFARGWQRALADAVADLQMRALESERFGAVSVAARYTAADGSIVTRTLKLTPGADGSRLRSLQEAAAASDALDQAESLAEGSEAQLEAAVRIIRSRLAALGGLGDAPAEPQDGGAHG